MLLQTNVHAATRPIDCTLTVRALTIAAGSQTLVTALTQTFPAGAMWCIAGPNGAGKTTLINTLAGIRKPQYGELALDGRLLAQWPLIKLARRRALMPQAWYPSFSANVFDTVLLARHPYLTGWGWEDKTDRAAVWEALNALGLIPLAQRDVLLLSGGERQRVALAAALCQGAPLLLLDEPLAQLDTRYQLDSLRLLRRWLAADARRGIIFSCHDLNLARQFATHALLLDGAGNAISGCAREVLTPALISRVFRCPFKLLCDSDHQVLMPVGDANG